MERNKTATKMAPHKIEQSAKINTNRECTHELTGTTTAAIERQRTFQATLMVTARSAC